MHLFVISVLLVFGFPFIMTKVVESFEDCSQFFLDQQPPEIPGILVTGASKNGNRYKKICQLYNNAYRFATLYDTTSKIPVFSAYKYTGSYKETPTLLWMIEPQLEVLDGEMREPWAHQADIEDYWRDQKQEEDRKSRGYLFPHSHAAAKDAAESTLTLTNAVPLYSNFHSDMWTPVELKVSRIMDYNCRDEGNLNNVLAFVLTGAVPSERNLLNKKINIPTFMWTVFCCYNYKTQKWESQAYWGENKQQNVPNINSKNLKKLQEFLGKKYGSESILFDNKCQDFLNWQSSLNSDNK